MESNDNGNDDGTDNNNEKVDWHAINSIILRIEVVPI